MKNGKAGPSRTTAIGFSGSFSAYNTVEDFIDISQEDADQHFWVAPDELPDLKKLVDKLHRNYTRKRKS